MQDRTSTNSMKVLLQRTAGPYIGVKSAEGDRDERAGHVWIAPEADQIQADRAAQCCQLGG
jgi:hypothetical protein